MKQYLVKAKAPPRETRGEGIGVEGCLEQQLLPGHNTLCVEVEDGRRLLNKVFDCNNYSFLCLSARVCLEYIYI